LVEMPVQGHTLFEFGLQRLLDGVSALIKTG
jgi:hypothetical protein